MRRNSSTTEQINRRLTLRNVGVITALLPFVAGGTGFRRAGKGYGGRNVPYCASEGCLARKRRPRLKRGLEGYLARGRRPP